MKRLIIFLMMSIISFSIIGCSLPMGVKGIVISSDENVRTIVVGEQLQLTATVYPLESSQEVIWSSDNEAILSVDEMGIVSGVSEGTASVIATYKYSASISQKFAMIVEKASEVELIPESITVSSVNGKTTCQVGETLSLMAVVLPREASQNVVWESSDTSIATVNRGDVKALKMGEVTITAYAKVDNTVYGSITITIEAKDKPEVSAEWSNMAFSSHEDYVNVSDDTKLKIKGMVTHVCPIDEDRVSYFIQNGNDGYYVYSQDALTYPVEEGKVYEVGGYKKNYRGINEIVNVEHFIEIDENITFNYINIDDENLTNLDEMKVYHAAYIKAKGTYVSGSLKSSSAYNIVVNVNGYDTTLRIDPAYTGDEEFADIYNYLSSALAGLELEFKGFVSAYGYGTPSTQIQIVSVDDLNLEQAADEDVLLACRDELAIATTVGFTKDTILLPTSVEGYSNVVISWSSNSDLINPTTGSVTHLDTDSKVILTATLSLNGSMITKEYEVLVEAKDDKVYETIVSFDLEDALEVNSYGCSNSKPGYEEGTVSLGTPQYDWLLRNALIAGSSSDKFEGTMCIRAKAGADSATTARIEIKEAGEYNVVQFAAAVYGNHVLGTQIKVEYTTDDGATWVNSGELITLNSHSLEVFRIKLPEGVKRVAIVVVENSGKTINIDSIALMK